jgi:hypothetical protein
VHAHDETTAHNVIVLKGEVDLVLGTERIAASSGAVLDFDGRREHTVRAISPAVILNLFLNGMPPGYRELPASERAGTYPPTNKQVK